MKKHIKIFVCALVLFVSYDVSAQLIKQPKPTTMDKLINKNWVMLLNNLGDLSVKERYLTTQRTATFVYQGNSSVAILNFYLSNQIETSFDYNKVGNTANGKYIISILNNGNTDTFSVYEIITLTNTYMELKSLKSLETFKYNAQ
jgi:hypothetical protein